MSVVVALVGMELAGPATTGAWRERTGGMPFTNGIRAWLSWTLAPEIPIDRGQTAPLGNQVDL